jgi:uncharacterized protein
MKSKAEIKGLVLKVASRCNLNCEYCYMYNLGDETYKLQPKFMSKTIVNSVLNNVRTYLTESGSKTFTFIFHGGEPLLVGYDFYQNFVRKVKELLPAHILIDYVIQTNGVLLTEEWCKVLGQLGIRIGISLDGPTEQSNKYRLDHQGKSTLVATLRAIYLMQQSNFLKYLPGLLSVIDVDTIPESLYQHYKSIKIKRINFLLPDGTYNNLPKNFDSTQNHYSDWLIRMFDCWFDDHDKSKPQISFFNQILHRILGGDAELEYFGGMKDINLIIETNGDIEPQDSLKACGENFTKTNLNITSHTLRDSLNQPLINFCHQSQHILCEQCKKCSVVEVCRGGYITHRFSKEKGFNNPSIYCHELKRLITYMSERVENELVLP